MYVIVRTDGRLVAPAGSSSSYVKRLQDARTWSTKEAAEAERCPENERVLHVDDILRRPRS